MNTKHLDVYTPPNERDYGELCPRCKCNHGGDRVRLVIGEHVASRMNVHFDFKHGICKRCTQDILAYAYKGTQA